MNLNKLSNKNDEPMNIICNYHGNVSCIPDIINYKCRVLISNICNTKSQTKNFLKYLKVNLISKIPKQIQNVWEM